MRSSLAGATVHGNDNNGSASMNARVIQMGIAKNVTVAQAYGVLGFVLTNQTGHVTAFALFIGQVVPTLLFVIGIEALFVFVSARMYRIARGQARSNDTPT